MKNLRGSATIQIDSVSAEHKPCADSYSRFSVSTEIGELFLSDYVASQVKYCEGGFVPGEYNVEIYTATHGDIVITEAERA